MQKITYIESVMRRSNIDADQHLAPFAAARSSIMKVRCSNTHAAANILFQIMRGLEKYNKDNEGANKVWAALEPPPEEGHRRRVLRQAAEEIKCWSPAPR